ncbi:Eukaryotic initiation factor 4E [Plasmodiophora brassicae]|uniref:Uncharacterized protein n=2 Tax=Plasmodiophora brassicae TaxID=37360 RepID=A0A3P3YBY8_PLABS|nr:unnamed protein product [Plasmodiophora brassicae]
MTDAQLEAQTSPAAAVDNADVPGNATSSGVDGSAAAVPSEDLPLQEPWTLWYDAPSKTKPVVWGESLVQVHTFDSIGGFWSLFNNLVPPSRLTQGSYYHVFRAGTKPEWEDARNEAGGKWVLSVQRQMVQKLNEIWLHTVMAMIGENFNEYSDHICGAVISVRPQKDRIALWTKTASDEAAVIAIGKQWKSLLNLGDGFRITYQAHKESMKTNKNRGGSLYEC